MITEAKKRGQRLMLIGAVLATLCAFLTYSVIKAYAEKAEQKKLPLIPVVVVATPIANHTYLTDVLLNQSKNDSSKVSGQGNSNVIRNRSTQDVCPDPKLNSYLIGSFKVCLVEESPILLHSAVIRLNSVATENDLVQKDIDKRILEELESRFDGQFTTLDLTTGTILSGLFLQRHKGPTIGKGMRAVSIGVDSVTNVDNRVSEGDHVDILVSYQKQAGNQSLPVTEILFENVEVLGASDNQQRFGTVPEELRFSPKGQVIRSTIVTLALPPKDALQLTCMENFAKEVRLLLRNANDQEKLNPAPVKMCAFE